MNKTLRLTCLVVALGAVPAVAHAQLGVYRPYSNAAMGERYHVEFAIGMWNPDPALTISSTRLDLVGTEIDAVKDLGFTQKKLPEFKVVIRPATKHKIRFDYIPVSYSAEATLTRTITFQGVNYTIGLPVNSTFDWKAYRFGYEYDAVYNSRGFFGIIGELKYTQVKATVASPFASGAIDETAPVPAFGGILRVYPSRRVAITVELTGSKLPERLIKNANGHYVDFDLYGTVNATDNVGAQVGYRSLDATLHVDEDSGTLKLTGFYVRGVVRF